MEYKGQLKGFPEVVVNKMLEYQLMQTGRQDISVFEERPSAIRNDGGFDWSETDEGFYRWHAALSMTMDGAGMRELEILIKMSVDKVKAIACKESKLYTESDLRTMYDMSCGKIGLGCLEDQTENNARFQEFLNKIKDKQK